MSEPMDTGKELYLRKQIYNCGEKLSSSPGVYGYYAGVPAYPEKWARRESGSMWLQFTRSVSTAWELFMLGMSVNKCLLIDLFYNG